MTKKTEKEREESKKIEERRKRKGRKKKKKRKREKKEGEGNGARGFQPAAGQKIAYFKKCVFSGFYALLKRVDSEIGLRSPRSFCR